MNLDLAIGFLFLLTGIVLSLFPQLFYKKVNPEQQARDRAKGILIGAIMAILGLVMVGLQTLK